MTMRVESEEGVKQLWEYGVEELAERCALAENEIERLRAVLQQIATYSSDPVAVNGAREVLGGKSVGSLTDVAMGQAISNA
jgi:uncharacterized small protein (DUF1192 family)